MPYFSVEAMPVEKDDDSVTGGQKKCFVFLMFFTSYLCFYSLFKLHQIIHDRPGIYEATSDAFLNNETMYINKNLMSNKTNIKSESICWFFPTDLKLQQLPL